MKVLGQALADLAILAGLGVCAWQWPVTVGVAEAVCAVGTVALLSVERKIQKSYRARDARR